MAEANTANSKLTTNFNVSPYFDDYDETKNYYRILFKPGYAVQARELTQMQTTLQRQITRLGRHIFKEGSIVIPGDFDVRMASNGTYEGGPGTPMPYVKISGVNSANQTIKISDFYQKVFRGQTSNVSAYINDVLPSDGTSQNTNTLYVTYLGVSDSNSSIRTFQEGETLISTDANVGTAIVLTSAVTSNVVGKASWFKISEGVFFAKEHFIYFPTQSVVLDRYNSLPTCRVGFNLFERIVSSSEDTSLLDPALESSNYSAPGADRLKLFGELRVIPLDEIVPSDFVTLFTVKDGIFQSLFSASQYNELGKRFAERTQEESGDYVVRGLTVQIREHDKIESPVPNFGKYANGNNSLLVASVDPGVGYVKGYKNEIFDQFSVDLVKPTQYITVNNQISTATMGSYLRVDELVGSWELDQSKRIQFYDAVQKRITNSGNTQGQKWSTGSQTGNNIGSAIYTGIEYVDGVKGYDAIYDIYLTDIKMTGTNTFSNVRSLYFNNSSVADQGADIYGANNSTSNTRLFEIDKSSLLYYVGSNYVKNIKDASGNPQTEYFFYKTDGVSSSIYIGTDGKSTITFSGPANQVLPYGTNPSGLSDTIVKEDITITCQESFNIGPLFSGAVVSVSGTTVTGVGTYFTRLNVGDKIQLSGKSNTWYITGITNDTSMTISNTATSITANTVFKKYDIGDIINMTGVGVDSGTKRTVTTTTSPQTITFDVKETWPTQKQITATYKVKTNQSITAGKTLNSNRLVKISCAAVGTQGPFCLGFPDVYKINRIVLKTGSVPSSLADGTDVTKSFTLDTGQRDSLYDLAHIVKSPTLTLGATDYLLISFNYFDHNFSGTTAYFSKDSYPIEDDDNVFDANTNIRTENIPIYVSKTTGLSYDLRNYLDFRPVKTSTANDTTDIATATLTPSNTSNSFAFSGSMLFPVPSSTIEYDFTYYLGRIDLITMNEYGEITSTQGLASANPITPSPKDGHMILAVVNIPPYPSLSPAYGNQIYRRDLACVVKKASNRVYTMRDIGLLDKRISNLEYYTSLSLLEKNALDLKILDENDEDRFKNGIFVDTFRDHSLSAKGIDRDYRIIVDPDEFSIRPLFSTLSLGYEFIPGSDINVTIHSDNVAMLDYEEKVLYSQPRVTETRLLERGTFFFQGTANLFPAEDVWVDTSYAADEVINIDVNGALVDINVVGPDAENQTASIRKNLTHTTWEDWKRKITGYKLYRGEGVNKVFVGNYTTEAAAQQAATAWTTVQGGGSATIEVLYNDTRSGTNYFANFSGDQGAGGNKLISSNEIQYIRPQTIAVECLNLKGYSKMAVFFDDVNVTAFCKPLSKTQYDSYVAGNPIPANSDGSQPQEGESLIVDDFGRLYFLFRIPGDQPKFRTGQKKLVVIDTLNLDAQTVSSTQDTSTVATGMFFAQGTAQTLQRTIYSVQGFAITSEAIQGQRDGFTSFVVPNTAPPRPKGHCCFDPDAKVLMANCTWKAIKDVMEGDEVIGDNGKVNKVIANKTIGVGSRKMLKLKGSNFYTTDDHLFLTKKGWKTWRPDIVINDADTINGKLLIGENRRNSIDDNDYLKTVIVKGNRILEEFVPYSSVKAEEFEFDPNYIVHDLTLDGNMSYIVEGYVVHNCCVAYSVLIRAPDDEEGVFCTGFDIFVERKSRTRGIWFEIGEMDNSGQVTNSRLPGTQVFFTNDQIPVSNTGGDNPLQIRFPSPVFLFNKTAYAFIVHSDSPSVYDVDPDTKIWVSRLGQTDRLTKEKVNDRENTGQYWQTTNNVNWYEVEDVDLKIDIYHAEFTATSGSFEMGNKPIERMLLSNPSLPLKNKQGNYFTTGDTLTVSGANGTISVGQRLLGNTSLNNANGVITLNPTANKYKISTTGYRLNEKVDVYSSNGAYTGISAKVTAIANGTAILSYVDETASNVYAEWTNSSGNFATNTTLILVEDNTYTANILSLNDQAYSSVSFEAKALDFIKTDISYEMDTYDDGSVVSSGYTQIIPSDTYYFKTNKKLLSRSNEIANISGSKSNKVRVNMQSISKYVSPVIDLDTTHTIYVDNIINANTSGETGKSGGQALNKYISQTVTLADGQDAEDIKVYVTSYRPPGTDVKVYVKLLHAEDSETLTQKNWIELEKENNGDSIYSSLSDRNNFKEYSYGLADDVMTGPFGEFQYTSGTGIKFTGYKYFAIKIVLIADDAAIVPRCSDLRVIALQI